MFKRLTICVMVICLTMSILPVSALANDSKSYLDYEQYSGDVNKDGTLTNSDLISLSRYLVGLSEIDADEIKYLADMDRSSSVTNADIVIMARMVVGLYDLDEINVAFIYDDKETPRTAALAEIINSDFDEACAEPYNEKNVKYKEYDADGNPEIQSALIDRAIADGANVLAIKLVSSADAQSICDKAKAADIPVIFFDCAVDEAVLGSYIKASVIAAASDSVGASMGLMAAYLVYTYMSKVDLNKDGKITYVSFTLDNESNRLNSEAAMRECRQRVSLYGNNEQLEYYNPQNSAELNVLSGGTELDAYNAMKAILKDSKVEMVLCINSTITMGCQKALAEAGYNNNSGKRVVLISGSISEELYDPYVNGDIQGVVCSSDVNIVSTLFWFINRIDGRYCYYINNVNRVNCYGYLNSSIYS